MGGIGSWDDSFFILSRKLSSLKPPCPCNISALINKVRWRRGGFKGVILPEDTLSIHTQLSKEWFLPMGGCGFALRRAQASVKLPSFVSGTKPWLCPLTRVNGEGPHINWGPKPLLLSILPKHSLDGVWPVGVTAQMILKGNFIFYLFILVPSSLTQG